MQFFSINEYFARIEKVYLINLWILIKILFLFSLPRRMCDSKIQFSRNIFLRNISKKTVTVIRSDYASTDLVIYIWND